MTRSPHWSQVAERGSMVALRLLIGFHRIFGRAPSLLIVNAVALYFFLTGPAVRRASLAYMRRIAAQPEAARALGRRPGAVTSFLHVRAFALSIFDRLLLWGGRRDDFAFEVSGVEDYDRLLGPRAGALVVGAHLGSFDALRALADRDGRVVNVLMETRHAERINAFFEQLAPDVRMRVIQADPDPIDTGMRIRSCIERGELVAMLGDRVAPGEQRACRVPFLGDPVEIPSAPYLLAALIGCPLFFMVALRSGTARYQVFAEVLSERVETTRRDREKVVQELAMRYVGRLEHYCARAPYQWFNFYDYWQEGAG